ncbi:hypothetical protein CO615_04645 [Lysobacteraceae bacterium NML75-0749]|nr:hypothetical protein CO615_04645 [Xanthomonadaceae bacterium NML75-0749]
MALFDLLQRLITEHGSSEILKNHLELVRSECTRLQQALDEARQQNQSQAEQIRLLQQQLQVLPRRTCHHCGSTDITHCGNIKDDADPFSVLGQMQARFTCTQCGQESRYPFDAYSGLS